MLHDDLDTWASRQCSARASTLWSVGAGRQNTLNDVISPRYTRGLTKTQKIPIKLNCAYLQYGLQKMHLRCFLQYKLANLYQHTFQQCLWHARATFGCNPGKPEILAWAPCSFAVWAEVLSPRSYFLHWSQIPPRCLQQQKHTFLFMVLSHNLSRIDGHTRVIEQRPWPTSMMSNEHYEQHTRSNLSSLSISMLFLQTSPPCCKSGRTHMYTGSPWNLLQEWLKPYKSVRFPSQKLASCAASRA